MIREAFNAMGTTVDVVTDQPDGVAAVRALFEGLERRFSRFLTDSELSRINREPRTRVRMSTPMSEMMGFAAAMRDRTGGLVDVGVGGQVVAWGYDRTFSEMSARVVPPAIVDPVESWRVEGDWLLRAPGTLFDLGGVAKGWAADLAVDAGYAVVVSAGGDVRSALADTVVEVEDPHGGSATRVELGACGLATSSVARRRWTVDNEQAHHIIDPRTGSPAVSPVVSATARCATAAEAEAAAKAVLLLGRSGLAWADDQEWISSALVAWGDGSVYATRGWEYAA